MTNTAKEQMKDLLNESKKYRLRSKELNYRFPSNDSIYKLQVDTEEFVAEMDFIIPCVEYSNMNKMLARCSFAQEKMKEGICYLIESHSVSQRQRILHRFLKNEALEYSLHEPQKYGLDPMSAKLDITGPEKINKLNTVLKEFPSEWYMIQVTAQHDHRKFIYNDLQRLPAMHSIHITVLPTGQQRIPLLCITVPTPKSQSTYDVCQEIHEILANCKFELQAPYSSKQIYWKMRQRQNDRMKTAVDGLEYTWLREWRILFMADPIDDLKSVKELQDMVDQLIANNSLIGITETSRWLLKKIVTSACFLTKREIELAIKHVLPGHTKLMKDIILFINEKAEEVKPLSSVKRKTLILIIDEQMDYIPFEAMEILKNHPVTRFPSLHIARALFKEHRNYIENGCRVVKNLGDIGTCIVNPSGNLMNMEKRMKVFMKYWLPRWTGLYNEEPQEDFFEKALTNHDVLMYNGHGSGIQYLSGEKIEKLRVRAIVLLFGCSSTKLIPIGGRFPPYGVSNQYLAACSPCILGMLWEVTDIDVDKMTASFVSNWIPAPLNARPWTDVIVNEWCNGNLKFKDKTEDIGCQSEEPEMLRAVAKSKQACSFYMTAAAAVVRGLPIIHQ